MNEERKVKYPSNLSLVDLFAKSSIRIFNVVTLESINSGKFSDNV